MGRMGMVAALCTLAFAMLSGSAQGEEKLLISASPTTVTLADNGTGTVAISNDSGVETTLTFTVVDQTGKAVPGASVDSPPEGKVAPGNTVPMTVTLPQPAAASTLVVVAAPTTGLPQGGVLRVPLSTAEPAKPAVTEWTYIQRHGEHDGGTQLPLTGPCNSLGFEQPKQIGTVQAGGEMVAITGSCSDENSKSLTLATSLGDSTGRTYKGTLKVAETDVTLMVEDTISWAIAALLILTGIVLALGIGAWQGWGRASKDLLRKSYLVERLVASSNEASVDRLFAAAAAKLELPANLREWTVAEAVKKKLAELRRSLRGSSEAAQLDTMRKELDALELELRGWPDVANLLGKLRQQSRKLVGLTAYRNKVSEVTLDRKGPLTLDAMREVKAVAQEAIGLAGDWPAEAIETARAIAEGLPPDDPARSRWTAVLDRFGAAKSVVDAKASLDDFWEVNEKLRQAAVPVELAEASIYKAIAPQRAEFFEPVETEDPADTARGLALRITLIDSWVLSVLLLAALIAGMQALWVDKSFGGPADVASALVWGLGAAAIGQPLSTALSDLGRSWLAPNKS